jgi:hypothetical protein
MKMGKHKRMKKVVDSYEKGLEQLEESQTRMEKSLIKNL